MEARQWLRRSPLAAISFLSSVLLIAISALAQGAGDTPKSDSDSSWASTTGQQGLSGNANPTRSSQSHTESGGRTIDRQSVETLGPDGRYVPYLDIERESVQVDANTIRTIERTFARNPDGRKTLQQVTEVEQHSGGSQQKTVRTTSNPDVNGRLQIVNREIQESRQTDPKVRETKTTVLAPDVNGSLAPAMLIQQKDVQGTGQNQFRKSTLLPDGNGGWQLSEVREGTIKQDGKDQIREERVSRPNADGKLAISERTVTKELQPAPGEKRETTETYSTTLPGTSEDGNLHLNQRVTKVQRARPDGGRVTRERVEERNPGAPGDTPQVTQQAIDIVRPGATGTTQTRTVQTVSEDGSSSMVWVDTQKASKPAAVQVEVAPTKPH